MSRTGWGNTVALGQLSTVVSNLTANAESSAESAAEDYAAALYNEYQLQIWMTGIAIVFWMLWVSTRDTAPSLSKK